MKTKKTTTQPAGREVKDAWSQFETWWNNANHSARRLHPKTRDRVERAFEVNDLKERLGAVARILRGLETSRWTPPAALLRTMEVAAGLGDQTPRWTPPEPEPRPTRRPPEVLEAERQGQLRWCD